MERSYSPKKAEETLGVTTHTIQAWDRQGRIRCLRPPTGRRRVPESEIRRLMSIAEQRNEAVYARVSSHDQRFDLDSQDADTRFIPGMKPVRIDV